ncbi:MAG: Aminopeptidase YpdF (MP-, MA-, MS-, AP-, NP- specific) [Ktedonobacterales bacterium]|nr:MAG: Aminopeptidase YpdF (MP-, MA-, MS-, AP-, NP- specific) [Ktedonobacterales bacterium]
MTQANYGRRLAETRQRMASAELDALLIASQYNRRYLTGFTPTDGDITESSGLALVTMSGLYLITGTFSISGLEHEIEPSGAELLLTDKTTAAAVLAQAAKDQGFRRLGFEKDWMSYGRYERLRKALDEEVEMIPSDDLAEAVRVVKDEAEIAAIRHAGEVADAAFAQLITELRPGMTERQIALRLEMLMREGGATEPSFPTIVACGPGGALPHWVPSDREAREGEPLLIDFGARVDGYCSDITRTFVLGEPDAKLVEVYHIVRAAQDAAEQALAAGAKRGRDVDAAARKVIADAGYGEQFMHGVGHGLGMAVHELPAATYLKTTEPEEDEQLAKIEGISVGMMITVEPGIYIPGWGGVRLEDFVLVRDGGIEILCQRNPEDILRVPVR